MKTKVKEKVKKTLSLRDAFNKGTIRAVEKAIAEAETTLEELREVWNELCENLEERVNDMLYIDGDITPEGEAPLWCEEAKSYLMNVYVITGMLDALVAKAEELSLME